MNVPARPRLLVLLVLTLCPAAAWAQDADLAFGAGSVAVVSEWRGEDRGDGSGSYTLITTATDQTSGVAIEHSLTTERAVSGEETSREALRAREGKTERALDPGAAAATDYVLPFADDFRADPRKNYRPQEKRIVEVVHGVVPEARITTRRGSDGRTTAVVEVPQPEPVDSLARHFVAIRRALREADLGLAKLQIKGRTTAPAATGTPVASETPGSS